MRECILLFHFEPVKQRKLVAQLMPLKMRVKVVSPEELNLPIGYLAGNKELQEIQKDDDVSTADMDSPMLVMAGLTGQGVNSVLQAIRKSGIGAVPYKAVVTQTNQTWRAGELLAELKKEHEAMKDQNNEGKMLHEQP